MKFIILIIVLGCFCLIACRPQHKSSSPANLHPLVGALQEEEYFKYVTDAEVHEIQQLILDDGYLFPEQLNRVYNADSEFLAECGVLSFLAEISPFLEKQGVYIPTRLDIKKVNTRNPSTGEVISVNIEQWVVDSSIPDESGKAYIRLITEDFPGSGDYYRVTIGDHTLEIWNSTMTPVQCWESATTNTLLLINELLKNAGSRERLYGLYGGNDGLAVFLTNEQFNLINESSAINDADKPREPHKFHE